MTPWVVDGVCQLDWDVQPVAIGPTWRRNDEGAFVLPELTLGWQILTWIKENLLAEDVDVAGRPQAFDLTPEQKRFILWWYAIDTTGAFIYRDGIFQRLKGHGKDPLVSVICAVEFLGPCRFGGWCAKDMPALHLRRGDPFGIEHQSAWVDVAAVSKEQTRNTMILFAGLFNEKCKREHYMNAQSMGKEKIFAHRGKRVIRAVTSNPRSLEGGRASFVVRNETHHWQEANNGWEMAAVIERNATKSKGGAARALSITNAYEPSENSVAQIQREAWESEQAGLSFDTGVVYDSLEIGEGWGLRPPELRHPVEGLDPDDEEIIVRAYLAKVIAAVRGDSWWLDITRITNSILSRENPPSRSRRFWFNQVVASEDSWVDSQAVDAAREPLAVDIRKAEGDALRAGWGLVSPRDEIVLFGDGSKSDDATALVACRLSDGYVFTGGVWQRPTGLSPKETWLVPRGEVDLRVDELMARFDVKAFWFDPSHALDDDNTRYWDSYCDSWHRRYSTRLDPKFWPVKTGPGAHSVMWDMTSMERQKLFVASAEVTLSEFEHRDGEYEQFDPLLRHDGHPALESHLKNARRNPMSLPGGVTGVSVRKEHRESARKIDLAVCLIGARMLRRIVLNVGLEEEVSVGGMAWAV